MSERPRQATARTDVLIVGSGIMGSIVARLLRESDPAKPITMVDGGSAIGEAPGVHLHDVDDPVLWSRYNERVVSGIQGMYTGAATARENAEGVGELSPGMHHATAFGEDSAAMPAAALAWNAGGMGVHWTAATPSPADDKVFDFGDPVGLSLDDLPLPRVGEFSTDSLWLPCNGAEQPFHGQIMNRTYVDDHGNPLAHSVGVSLYAPVLARPENRLVFSPTETDLTGMPRIGIEFGYTDEDHALIGRALEEARSIAEEFGPFDPATERALLPPGSSLHLTGTVRAGRADDGTCVCGPDGRVWDLENLYLAGNGVIPTAMAANVTLTGAVTAVRAARAVAGASAARAEHREEV